MHGVRIRATRDGGVRPRKNLACSFEFEIQFARHDDDSGLDAFLKKPFDLDQLASVVASMTRRRNERPDVADPGGRR
jgi:hypothetical protein